MVSTTCGYFFIAQFVLIVSCYQVSGAGEKDYRLQRSVEATQRSGNIPTKCEDGVFIICKNCRQLKQCVEKAPTTDASTTATTPSPSTATAYDEVSILNCTSSQTCSTGVCAADPSSTCSPLSGLQFPCVQQGTFPDPADCTKYVVCNSARVPETTTCLRDGTQAYGFNKKTLLCSDKLLNNKCSGLPVPICPSNGYSDALPLNPSYYYFCLKIGDVLYPFQRICSFGRTFSKTRGCY